MLHKRRIANLTFILLSIFIFFFTKCDIKKSDEVAGTIDKNPEDSIVRKYYPNGKLSSVVVFKNGMQHGDSKYYYSNGNMKYEVVFQNGKEHGEARHYYQNGKLYQVVPYTEGIIHGVRKKYYKNGGILQYVLRNMI
jgi:antitoxin component YwqK of YwqJK toxin-antitoxin module